MSETKMIELATWRYGIISPLLHRNDDGETLEEALDRLASKTFRALNGQFVQYSPETLRKWFYRYRNGGLPGLRDAPGKHIGTHASFPITIEERLFELRQAHPRWTFSRILGQLVYENVWDMQKPSRATLYRYAGTANLKRDPVKALQPAKPFAYTVFGQLWMADFLHGPKIRINGQKRKTYLHAIIDDATRYGVRAGFFLSENTEVLMTELKSSVRTHGKPRRFYTDNGACYSSKHLLFVCGNLGIDLIHTPPGEPRGRGKIERFFRTVRDQFLDGDTPPGHTLDGINRRFKAWLSRYHETIHSALQMTPNQKRLSHPSACVELPEAVDIDPLFRMKRRCRVYMNFTIRLKKIHYQVPEAIPGTRVDVWFMPWDLGTVWYGPEMKPAKPANLALNALRRPK